MKLINYIQFVVLFLTFCFITFINLNVGWLLILFVVAFAYYVAVKHFLREEIEKEVKLKTELPKGVKYY
jgi:hypothetical protein